MAWRGRQSVRNGGVVLPKEAIAEAVRLASQAFVEHADEYILEPAA